MRMNKVSINENWVFTKSSTIDDKIGWEEIHIPHTWNNIDGQDGGNDYYRGLCHYKNTLQIEPHQGRLFLEFEGVNSIATVYLNNIMIGVHEGGYSIFRFDITDACHIGDNELIVSVDNGHVEHVVPLQADFTFYGGIYRNCYLVYTNNISFDLSYFGSNGVVVKQQTISRNNAEFDVDCYMKNYGIEQTVQVQVSVIDHLENLVIEDSCHVYIEKATKTTVTLNVDKPHLWDGIDDPYLYTLKVNLLVEDDVVDERLINLGLRYFHMDDKAFYLNGKECRLNGVSRHQDWEGIGNALLNTHHDRDMELIKEIGANSIRLAHYQHAPYFYDLCDRAGMIVWAEIPYITRPSKTDNTGTNPLQQMNELIIQNYNHPSIVMWGVQNEITISGKKNNVENIVTDLHNLAKNLDPYRLTTQANLLIHPIDDSMNAITDINAYNLYFGWYVGEVTDFRDWLLEFRGIHPNQPIGISEYGVEGNIKYHSETPQIKDYTEEYHAWWHEQVYSIFSNTDFIWGTYVWNMFVFGSDMRNEGGVRGQNNKGLVSFDRMTKKDAFYFYQAKWSKQPVLHLTSKRFVERHNRTITIKVYSNMDEVQIYINDKEVTPVKNDVIFTADVALKDGSNQIRVVAETLEDGATFIRVKEPNKKYIVPENKTEKMTFFNNVKDWFEDDSEIEEHLQIDKDNFSINDPIIDLLDVSETEKVLKLYFPMFFEKNIISSISMLSLATLNHHMEIPRALLSRVNQELQKYKKTTN